MTKRVTRESIKPTMHKAWDEVQRTRLEKDYFSFFALCGLSGSRVLKNQVMLYATDLHSGVAYDSEARAIRDAFSVFYELLHKAGEVAIDKCTFADFFSYVENVINFNEFDNEINSRGLLMDWSAEDLTFSEVCKRNVIPFDIDILTLGRCEACRCLLRLPLKVSKTTATNDGIYLSLMVAYAVYLSKVTHGDMRPVEGMLTAWHPRYDFGDFANNATGSIPVYAVAWDKINECLRAGADAELRRLRK